MKIICMTACRISYPTATLSRHQMNHFIHKKGSDARIFAFTRLIVSLDISAKNISPLQNNPMNHGTVQTILVRIGYIQVDLTRDPVKDNPWTNHAHTMQSGSAIITRVQIVFGKRKSSDRRPFHELNFCRHRNRARHVTHQAGCAENDSGIRGWPRSNNWQSCPARTKTAALGDGVEEAEKWR